MLKWIKATGVAFLIFMLIAFSWVIVPVAILAGLICLVKAGMDADEENE